METHIAISDEPSKKKFKPFHETFKACAFGMAVGLLYPNRKRLRIKLIILGIILTINSAEMFWIFNYTVNCLITKDINNFTRIMSLVLVIMMYAYKLFLMNYYSEFCNNFINRISDDLMKGNDEDEDTQKIYDYYISVAKTGQLVWIIIPVAFTAQFPVYSGIANIFSTLKSDVGPRYMQHEVDLKYLEDKQYESPYFEMIYAYNFAQIFPVMPVFIGFGGLFCIATADLQLKMKLVVRNIEKALNDSIDVYELRQKVKNAIKDHQEALIFYNDIHWLFGSWLLAVFTLSALMISINIYQIYLNGLSDLRFIIFIVSGITYVYTPCYFASDLLEMSEHLSYDIYCTPWEKWNDPVVTKLLIMVIAKAQEPLYLTGKGFVIFSNKLFISIMQTSYSVFTLITS